MDKLNIDGEDVPVYIFAEPGNPFVGHDSTGEFPDCIERKIRSLNPGFHVENSFARLTIAVAEFNGNIYISHAFHRGYQGEKLAPFNRKIGREVALGRIKKALINKKPSNDIKDYIHTSLGNRWDDYYLDEEETLRKIESALEHIRKNAISN